MKTNLPILHLNLVRKWFDMVSIGEKKEEYRAYSPYWIRVFSNGLIKIKGCYYQPNNVIICFSNGYAKNRSQIFYTCKGLKTGFGNEVWGANSGTKYFILQIGEKL